MKTFHGQINLRQTSVPAYTKFETSRIANFESLYTVTKAEKGLQFE